MKHYTEVLEQIKEMTKEKNHAREEIKNADNKYSSYFDGLTLKERIKKRKTDEAQKIADEHMKTVEKWGNAEIDCKIKIAILKNNAKIALMNDVIDVVIESFNRYAGKPYGEKTKDKISHAIQEKTNCCAYVTGNQILVAPVNSIGLEDSIKIGTTDFNIKILVDNKIQTLEKENFCLWDVKSNYIEDLDAEARTIRNMQAEIMKRKEELEQMCIEYNSHAVKGINHISLQCDAYASF